MTHWHPHDYAGVALTAWLIVVLVIAGFWVASFVMRRPRGDRE